jgi:hypothetical protein
MKISDEKLLEFLIQVAEDHHTEADGHDPENLRGCTHPDCQAARLMIKLTRKMIKENKAREEG